MGATVVPSNTKVVRHWYGCSKCRALFYCEDTSSFKKDKRGACAKGDTHDLGTPEVQVTDTGAGEAKWYHCKQCSQMFYNGGTTSGTCPSSGPHVAGTVELHLVKTTVSGVSYWSDWKRCKKCETLYQPTSSSNGPCAKGGSHEEASTDKYQLEKAYEPGS